MFSIENENYSRSIIGSAVDYLTRFYLTNNVEKTFEQKVNAIKNFDLEKNAKTILEKKVNKYLNNISKLNRKTIFNVLNLLTLVPTQNVIKKQKPNRKTIKNIKNMVKNSLKFFEKYGPCTEAGFIFQREDSKIYHEVITGELDFLTRDTLWDLKVREKGIAKYEDTLQLLLYFLMGKKTKNKIFDNIRYIGIYNPRLNKFFKYDVKEMDQNILKDIATKIINYKDTSFIDNMWKEHE